MKETSLDARLLNKIQKLKKDRNAVILAHNYQPGEIQDLADFCGDSLGLSIEASKTDAQVIVFCGVKFMAETATILSPEKMVLLPEKTAGCPMADMITAEQLKELKSKHPKAIVVCYVNSTAHVKAESDYCCTSSNAVEVVKSLPNDKEVIFVPDKNLGAFVSEKTGRKMILWPGYCTTHIHITADDIAKAKEKYPDAVVMCHPECNADVRAIADELLSTGQMLKFVNKNTAKRYIIGTEKGIIHTLKKQRPDAEYICPTEKAICPNMKKITIDKVIWSLEQMREVITIDEKIREKAKKALERMVEIVPAS